MILERHREEPLQPRPLFSVAKSTRSSSAAAFTHGTSSIVAPPPIISAVATSHPMPSPYRPAVVSIRSRSVSASTRMTSAAAPRRSTSSAPSARRVPRRVPLPVVEEADYIPYEDAVSSDVKSRVATICNSRWPRCVGRWRRCTTWCMSWLRPQPSR